MITFFLLGAAASDAAAQWGCNSYAYYGAAQSYCAPSRVRWEMSHCGTYRYFISETSYWIPGGWVRWGGCRRWNDGYWAWRPVVRRPVYGTTYSYYHCGQVVNYCYSPTPYYQGYYSDGGYWVGGGYYTDGYYDSDGYFADGAYYPNGYGGHAENGYYGDTYSDGGYYNDGYTSDYYDGGFYGTGYRTSAHGGRVGNNAGSQTGARPTGANAGGRPGFGPGAGRPDGTCR